MGETNGERSEQPALAAGAFLTPVMGLSNAAWVVATLSAIAGSWMAFLPLEVRKRAKELVGIITMSLPSRGTERLHFTVEIGVIF